MNNKLLKLHDIFLRKFLLLFTSIFIILGFIVYFWLKDIYIEQIKNDLSNNIDLLYINIKSNNTLNNIDNIVKQIKDKINTRVTIINSTGLVISESNKDKKYMDNHLNRIEVQEAYKNDYGFSIRYSHTLNKDLLYLAKKYTFKNDIYFIRMAKNIDILKEHFLYLSFKVFILFIIFMGFAFYISLKISKDVQDETKKILVFLKSLSKHTKKIYINSTYSSEFKKITRLLSDLSDTLVKKDKQKSKYTAKLKLSNRQKDEIISAISHEFKNPIAVISGYTQTLLEDDDIDINIRKKFLNKISTNSSKLTNMIDRLRLSIRLDENKQELNLSKLNISNIVKTICEDLKITYINRTININVNDTIIQADETLINIAISNLIENSLKYSSEDITINITENYIDIIDLGIGIKKEDIDKITKKFYRVSSNKWNNSLGLGLSLVNTIINLHNFTLKIYSKENESSTFRIIWV